MHVLYYLYTFPKLSESFILNEIYELEQMGHDVSVFALTKPEENIVHDEFDELSATIRYTGRPGYSDVTELLSPKLLHPAVLRNALFPANPIYHAANLFWTKRCREFIADIESPIDVVHTHFATPVSLAAQYVAAVENVPFTVTTHAHDIYAPTNESIARRLLERADRIVTISEQNQGYIQKHYTNNTPIDIVRAGIRPTKFYPSDADVDGRLFTVARFVEKKGIEYAIDAVAEIVDEFPTLEYHIVGSGPLRSEFEESVEEYGISDHVTFLDSVSDERLRSEYDEAQGFILPCVVEPSGDRDGIPVVLMEAMAMRTAPISTTISGIPELVEDGENGLLVEPRNSEAVANALRRLLSDDDERDRFGERARQKIANDFNVTSETQKLAHTFQAATR
ncbi:Glycosyltransferase involved in cell wall bisynthesis [Halorubrum xinjiangense]|uniref:Glycosyltransferase involved in cell wall bisynthesis n=1 Tax=Halorubrum xinjiangense TaxID=261291 RepID=A0A1G7SIV0_9EURY|nr:glycosyltransferase [Halorubrum xinjiangense]SDG22160.1 Glycosyltransferase involved in cell wall bisynthesis [Halorubrum xinjiangense]